MRSILYLEVNLIGIAILLIIFFFGRMDGSKLVEQRIFTQMLITAAIILLSDSLTWLLEGNPHPLCTVLLQVMQWFFFATTVFIAGQWVLYNYIKLHGKTPSLAVRLLIWVSFCAFAGLLLVNLSTGWIYSYDSNNIYRRGPLYFLHPAMVLCYLLCSGCIILKGAMHRSRVKRRDAYQLLLFAVPPLTGVALQVLFYGISLIPISITLAMLIAFAQHQNALVTCDHLTRLSNARAFEGYMERKLQNPPDHQLLFLMMLDADHFKKINDTFGHDTGNEALVKMSAALKRTCNRTDFIARLGGDEFAISGHRASKAEVEALIEAIEDELQRENAQPDTPYQLAFSIGYVLYDPIRHPSIDALLKAADTQMYEIKRRRHAVA